MPSKAKHPFPLIRTKPSILWDHYSREQDEGNYCWIETQPDSFYKGEENPRVKNKREYTLDAEENEND